MIWGALSPPTVYLPVSRLDGPLPPPRSFAKGIDVMVQVLDARGRPVDRGFVSFSLPRVGWCGNETRSKGRVAFTRGVFQVALPGAESLTVVAEDGRSTSVRVEPGLFRTVTAVLPDHPAAPSGADAVLPWALPLPSSSEKPARRFPRAERKEAARTGPPRTACEYLAGARFETVVVPPEGAVVLEFPARSPGDLATSSAQVDCDGWNLVEARGGGETGPRVGYVEPTTGRLVFKGNEYLRAGLVQRSRED
ncbi:hypothetical protein LXT21_28865 [Myxococcus sp. K38C18041901]|uniref:hypothetical protein n=1 Tax=Myxococcus guangdongensis TaxID=2906760 RepID=UPI0020A6F036|nr:hypothetical protein [Myxococcus guangdongensis]MCP3062805.1 hypothetical protein [Myxococcus guangdongensis]